MNEDTKQLFICVAAVVAIVMTICISSSMYYSASNRAYIEGGYEQRTLQGEEGIHWVKIKDAESSKGGK